MSNIKEPLKRLFKKHRLVFWYDTDRELRADYDDLELVNVEKVF